MTIRYTTNKDIPVQDFCQLCELSQLDQKRPLDDTEKMAEILQNSSILVSAYEGEKIVGVCRSISDFTFVTYISELIVHPEYQQRGIGSMLIKQTKTLSKGAKRLVLLSSKTANNFYSKMGFEQHDRAWFLDS